jgi:hypothetical protein
MFCGPGCHKYSVVIVGVHVVFADTPHVVLCPVVVQGVEAEGVE